MFGPKYRHLLIGFAGMSICDYFQFLSTIFESGTLELSNLNYNVIFMSCIQASIYIIVLFFIDNIPRVKGFHLSLLGIFFAVLVIIGFAMFPYYDKQGVITGLFIQFDLKVCCSVIDILFWTYGAEVFPSEIRGSATGFGIYLGKLMSLFSPYFIMIARKMNLHPLVGPAAVSLQPVFLTYNLPESLTMTIK